MLGILLILARMFLDFSILWHMAVHAKFQRIICESSRAFMEVLHVFESFLTLFTSFYMMLVKFYIIKSLIAAGNFCKVYLCNIKNMNAAEKFQIFFAHFQIIPEIKMLL